MAEVDTQIVELSKQVKSLLQEVDREVGMEPVAQSQQPQATSDMFSLNQIMTNLGLTCSEEELKAKLKHGQVLGQENSGPASATVTIEEPPVIEVTPGYYGPGMGSHRGPAAATAEGLSGTRRKPKEIPVPTVEQKAAPVKAATGLARAELLNLARANNDNDSNADVEESDAIRLRLEQEMDQQTLP